MGFNTVVLLLNDYSHAIFEHCPRALAWAVTHPPMSAHADEMDSWWQSVGRVAYEHKEDIRYLYGGLRVLPTYHADDKHVLLAGHNLLERVPHTVRESPKGDVVLAAKPEWWGRF